MNRLLRLYCILAMCLPAWGIMAQQKGVSFQEISYSQALEKAEKEKKLIFIDFYTEWCGPCKRMSKEVFTQKSVGDYFNRTFVCLKLDAEKGEGKELAKKYKIRAYPTFVVLSADGTEVYATSGFRPAEEFVEKIRKGTDPDWSPAGLTRRYEKGERSPGLINDYALMLMETGKQKEGDQVILDYFNSLSARKRVKPVNFFLYDQYAFNLKDNKARYLFEHKDAFVKANGKGKVDTLLYKWLRFELIPFMTLRTVAPVSEEDFRQVKEGIVRVGMEEAGSIPHFLSIAEVRMKRDLRTYLETCRKELPLLQDQDRFMILLDLDMLKNETKEIKAFAADLIREHLDCVEGINRRVLRMKMLELENKKDYTLRAEIDAVKQGKVVVMGWSPRKSIRDTFSFQNHRIDLNMAGQDTLKVTLKLLCDELECPTKRLGTYSPNVDVLLVPGEQAVIKIRAEKGKVPQVEWIRGGEVSRDYWRLNYELLSPAERAYQQLTMDNIIQGGDIRDYKSELEAYMKGNKETILNFVRNNPTSFVTAMNLLEHYNWFDENEIEQIYAQFPPALKTTTYGCTLKSKLDAGRAYRSGTLAPDFTKRDMKGKTVSLSRLKGKYVLLDFWGSWCGPCRASHPHLKELHQKYGKRMVFINVANENTRDLAEARKLWKRAVSEDGLSWTQLLNNEEIESCNLLKLFHISSFPTKILIDPEGHIVARYVGALSDPSGKLKEIFGE